MEVIAMLGLVLYLLLAGCACALCYLLGMHRRPRRGEGASPQGDNPAQILKEWLYGGDEE